MAQAKKRTEQHLIDQAGEQLLREKLPRHWLLHPYRPDYGLDFTLETFGSRQGQGSEATYETLGEHIFLQLKSVSAPTAKPLPIYARRNVEKERESLDTSDQVAVVDTYRFSLEMSELTTIERMGVGVPVLLVLADLQASRCSFVCVNDYIDKILVPRYADYHLADSRTVHVPLRNEVGTEFGQLAMRWYAKRPKLLAAFQRFTYQYSELNWAEHGNWRGLAEYFARRIVDCDFWGDTEMWALIPYLAAALARFIHTGQPGLFKVNSEHVAGLDDELIGDLGRRDVFELWRQLALLPKTYEDVCREWFLPTGLGEITSAPP